MMKKILLFVGIIYVIIFLAPLNYACEPCLETLDLQETVNQSDLIVVGQRTDYPLDGEESFPGPETINVEIKRTLKGFSEETQIKVHSWSGMCGYGIVVDDKDYVMFLQKIDSYLPEAQYDAVNFGCAVRTFSVENEMVDFDGKNISLEEFARGLDLQDFKTNGSAVQPGQNDDQKNGKTNDVSVDQTINFYPVLLLLFVLILVFFILKLRKR